MSLKIRTWYYLETYIYNVYIYVLYMRHPFLYLHKMHVLQCSLRLIDFLAIKVFLKRKRAERNGLKGNNRLKINRGICKRRKNVVKFFN